MAALLTIESQNSDKVALYLGRVPRARRAGAAARHQRERSCSSSSQPEGVRFGLGAVKGVGEGAILSILEARAALGGRIASLFELAEHVDLRLVNKKVLESLVKAGAFDALAPPAAASRYLSWRAARCSPASTASSTTAAGTRSDREQGQSQLFGGDASAGRRADDDAALPDAPAVDRDARRSPFEKEALGLYMSGHPLQRVRRRCSHALGARARSAT